MNCSTADKRTGRSLGARTGAVYVLIGYCYAGDIMVQTSALISRNRLLGKILLQGQLCWIIGLGVCRLSR